MRIRPPFAVCCALALAVTATALAANSVPPQLMTPDTVQPVYQPFRSVSGDGSRIYLMTAEKLVDADGDSAVDVYERAIDTGVLRLVSDRVQAGADAEVDASFAGVAHDGSRVVFITREPLLEADGDVASDVYELSANGMTLLSDRVQNGADADKDVNFAGTSRDAAITRFVTEEPLSAADGDDAQDLYVRHAGAIKLVSDRVQAGPDAAVAAGGGIASPGGTRLLFQTNEAIVTTDGDAHTDLYLHDLATGATTLVSDRVQAGDDAAVHIQFPYALSPDGSHVFFMTAEALTADDTDTTGDDVYDFRVADSVTALVSDRVQAGADENKHAGMTANGMPPSSTDGTRVIFVTSESLLAEDTDGGMFDTYERSSGTTKLLSDDPTNDADAAQHAFPHAVSPDGSRVVFVSFESMSPDDTDSSQDVYLREGSTTTLLSDGVGADQGGPGFSTAQANRDVTRVFFGGVPPLVPEDGDTTADIYESAGGVLTLLTDRTKAGPDESQVIQSIAFSEDGSRFFFGTDEQLVDADADATRDVYWAGGTALPDPKPTVTPTPTPTAEPTAEPTAAPTATPTAAPTAPQPPLATPPPLKAAEVLTLPAAKRCVSRRKFRIKLKRPGGTRIVRVVVTVNGKRSKTVTRPTATVDLRGLPKGRVTVRIEVRTADGRSVKQTRRYRTCAPRRRG